MPDFLDLSLVLSAANTVREALLTTHSINCEIYATTINGNESLQSSAGKELKTDKLQFFILFHSTQQGAKANHFTLAIKPQGQENIFFIDSMNSPYSFGIAQSYFAGNNVHDLSYFHQCDSYCGAYVLLHVIEVLHAFQRRESISQESLPVITKRLVPSIEEQDQKQVLSLYNILEPLNTDNNTMALNRAQSLGRADMPESMDITLLPHLFKIIEVLNTKPARVNNVSANSCDVRDRSDVASSSTQTLLPESHEKMPDQPPTTVLAKRYLDSMSEYPSQGTDKTPHRSPNSSTFSLAWLLTSNSGVITSASMVSLLAGTGIAIAMNSYGVAGILGAVVCISVGCIVAASQKSQAHSQ